MRVRATRVNSRYNRCQRHGKPCICHLDGEPVREPGAAGGSRRGRACGGPVHPGFAPALGELAERRGVVRVDVASRTGHSGPIRRPTSRLRQCGRATVSDRPSLPVRSAGDTDGSTSSNELRNPKLSGRNPPVSSVGSAHFRPEEASPSITRRCSRMNRIRMGAMASRLAAISTG